MFIESEIQKLWVVFLKWSLDPIFDVIALTINEIATFENLKIVSMDEKNFPSGSKII